MWMVLGRSTLPRMLYLILSVHLMPELDRLNLRYPAEKIPRLREAVQHNGFNDTSHFLREIADRIIRMYEENGGDIVIHVFGVNKPKPTPPPATPLPSGPMADDGFKLFR